MTRPSWDLNFLTKAKQIAEMGTCARRQVGCILVDEHNVELASGFNGTPPGWPHCRYPILAADVCEGAYARSGTNLDACLANHAEINALIKCPDVTKIRTVYTTTSPCVSCVKAILCTYASRIVFSDEYSQPYAKLLWLKNPLSITSIRGRTIFEHRHWIYVDSEGKETVTSS